MKSYKAYFKKPGQDPVEIRTRPDVNSVYNKVGGAYYKEHIRLSNGKEIELFYYQMSVRENMEYNFTICPTEDKRTWIDICGPVLVTADVIGSDLQLTAEEMKELFRVPYEL